MTVNSIKELQAYILARQKHYKKVLEVIENSEIMSPSCKIAKLNEVKGANAELAQLSFFLIGKD